ncbi:MAG: TIGR03619 family F420-dependent LLM class oxidoreductase [Myxococcota bacterium]
MKLGIFGINTGPCARPETAAKVARAAEAAGFESVWTGEHVVLPDPQAPPSPAPPEHPMLDPAVALAFLAGQTERLRLATGIIILPQRNPVVLAKELASVDVLSNGRLIAGVAAGYLHQEFAALGTPFETRGARTDEFIDVLRVLWTEPKPAFDGPTVRFGGIDAQPRPVQQPHPPIVVGGTSPPALRRAVTRGNGWYGFLRDLDTTKADLAGLAAAEREAGRPAGLGALEITITPLPRIDLETARRYQDLGVDRLALLPLSRDEASMLRWVESTAEALVRKLS